MNKTRQEFLKNLMLFLYKFRRFPVFEKLAVILPGSTPSFVKTDDILSLQESDHLFYPNTADEINKQSQGEEGQKRRLDIVLNERPCEIEKGMIFDAKKFFENFSGNIPLYIKLSCQFV